MTSTRTSYELKKKSKVPALVGAAVAVAVVAGAVYAYVGRGGQQVVFGDTLKVHFEPAMAGEEKLIRYAAEKIAPDYGLKLEAVPLQDSVQANRAVAEGQYAATIHQHQWWLKQVVDANGFALTPSEPIFQWAFGVYSDRYKSVAELPRGAVVVVPNDGANQGQALWLLQRAGLIGLDGAVEPRTAKLRDIKDNPHGFEFKEMDLLCPPARAGLGRRRGRLRAPVRRRQGAAQQGHPVPSRAAHLRLAARHRHALSRRSADRQAEEGLCRPARRRVPQGDRGPAGPGRADAGLDRLTPESSSRAQRSDPGLGMANP